VFFKSGLDSCFVAYQQKLEPVVAVPRQSRARDHHAHTFVAAHRVNGDTRRFGHNIVS
jgi:hypothetical protein